MIKNKYHAPIKENLEYIEALIKDGAKVLEIGPGFEPFSKATEFCGWTTEEQGRLKNYKIADASSEMLPYKDKEFDMWNGKKYTWKELMGEDVIENNEDSIF